MSALALTPDTSNLLGWSYGFQEVFGMPVSHFGDKRAEHICKRVFNFSLIVHSQNVACPQAFALHDFGQSFGRAIMIDRLRWLNLLNETAPNGIEVSLQSTVDSFERF